MYVLYCYLHFIFKLPAVTKIENENNNFSGEQKMHSLLFIFVNAWLKYNDFHVLQSYNISKKYPKSLKCESFEFTV